MKPLVIFGTGDIAQLAHYYFSHDSDRRVTGFTVDGPFLTRTEFCALPVIPFDEIVQSGFHPKITTCSWPSAIRN